MWTKENEITCHYCTPMVATICEILASLYDPKYNNFMFQNRKKLLKFLMFLAIAVILDMFIL